MSKFLSDMLPTGLHANELARVGEGDNVAIWGAGPGMFYYVTTCTRPSLGIFSCFGFLLQ